MRREASERSRPVVSSENKVVELPSQTSQIKLEYACWSRAGADPQGRTKQNQDGYVVEEFMGGSNTCFFGVFDGHGSDGAKVSRHLVTALPRLLASCDSFKAHRYKEALQTQIPLCNRHLSSLPHINSRLSGSTAIVAFLEENCTLTIANVGDSRCMLGRVKNGVLQVAALNTDHTPEVPAEADRILSNKGRIGPYIFKGVHVGPKRIWLPSQDLPGLSMTRALGDQLGATVGVSAEPEITQIVLTPDDKYLVLCSDGLFEFMDNEYIMSIVHHQAQQGWHPSDIAKCLVAEANRQWIEEEDGIIDDCTIILVVLNIAPAGPTGPPTPPQVTTAQPISSVARAMNDIARQTSNLLTPDTALGRKHSHGKLSVSVNQ